MEKGQLIARGRTAEVYQYGEGRVLKLFYSWYPDMYVEREAEHTKRIVQSGIRAPMVYGMVGIEERKGIIFQQLRGETYLNIISRQGFSLPEYTKKMAKIHTQILAHEDASLSSLKARLHDSISGLPNLPGELKKFCLQILDELPDGNAICHFDFHPDQIMQTTNGDYVIDWSSLCRGNPCADIARTSYLLTMSTTQHLPWLLRILIKIMRATMHRIYIKQMLKLNPMVTIESIEKWKIPISAGRLAENIEEENLSILSFLEKAYSKSKSKI